MHYSTSSLQLQAFFWHAVVCGGVQVFLLQLPAAARASWPELELHVGHAVCEATVERDVVEKRAHGDDRDDRHERAGWPSSDHGIFMVFSPS